MNRIARSLAVTAAAASAALVPAGVANAEDPVLVETHGAHEVWVVADELYPVPETEQGAYWGFVPLDGMCGVDKWRIVLSDMTETFFVQTQKSGAFTGIGKILDESFVLTELDADGNTVRVYEGTGDEYAQFRGTGAVPMQSDSSVNLRVSFRGDSEDGKHIYFALRLQMRTDAQTGDITRMDASVTSCTIH